MYIKCTACNYATLFDRSVAWKTFATEIVDCDVFEFMSTKAEYKGVGTTFLMYNLHPRDA